MPTINDVEWHLRTLRLMTDAAWRATDPEIRWLPVFGPEIAQRLRQGYLPTPPPIYFGSARSGSLELWVHISALLVGSVGAGGLIYLIEKQWNMRLRIKAEEVRLRTEIEQL